MSLRKRCWGSLQGKVASCWAKLLGSALGKHCTSTSGLPGGWAAGTTEVLGTPKQPLGVHNWGVQGSVNTWWWIPRLCPSVHTTRDFQTPMLWTSLHLRTAMLQNAWPGLIVAPLSSPQVEGHGELGSQDVSNHPVIFSKGTKSTCHSLLLPRGGNKQFCIYLSK